MQGRSQGSTLNPCSIPGDQCARDGAFQFLFCVCGGASCTIRAPALESPALFRCSRRWHPRHSAPSEIVSGCGPYTVQCRDEDEIHATATLGTAGGTPFNIDNANASRKHMYTRPCRYQLRALAHHFCLSATHNKKFRMSCDTEVLQKS